MASWRKIPCYLKPQLDSLWSLGEILNSPPCIQRLPGASSALCSLLVTEVAPTAGCAPSSRCSCLLADAQVPPLIWLMTHHKSRPIPSFVLGSAHYPSATSDPWWPFTSCYCACSDCSVCSLIVKDRECISLICVSLVSGAGQ